MASEKEFQQKVRQLGTLVGELDRMSGSGSTVAARELVQLLMEVHGAGLERLLELVFESSAKGETMIGILGRDPIVRNLLLLYSLHPEDMETRVLRALDEAGARLRKLDCEVELAGIRDGAVQVRVHASGHTRGSAAKNLRSIVEAEVYDMAPDVASLTLLGLEEEAASGFVSLDSLLKNAPAPCVLSAQGVGVNGTD